jgi:hypothetical protein
MIPESLRTHSPRISVPRIRVAAITVLLIAASAFAASAQEPLTRTPSPEGARIYFIGIADGDEVASPLLVRFGLSGMGVAPAGIENQKTGHHHLLIDGELADYSLPIPADEKHRHFGGGQTEVSIELPPGDHTLQLVLADYRHIPHEPPVVSKRIRVTVK